MPLALIPQGLSIAGTLEGGDPESLTPSPGSWTAVGPDGHGQWPGEKFGGRRHCVKDSNRRLICAPRYPSPNVIIHRHVSLYELPSSPKGNTLRSGPIGTLPSHCSDRSWINGLCGWRLYPSFPARCVSSCWPPADRNYLYSLEQFLFEPRESKLVTRPRVGCNFATCRLYGLDKSLHCSEPHFPLL